MNLRDFYLLAALIACSRLDSAVAYNLIYTVPEELPENVSIGNILKDLNIPHVPTATGATVIYKLASDTWGAPLVTVSSPTGDIVTTSKSIDREELCAGASSAGEDACFFELKGSIISDDIRPIRIKIIVKDINDHAPVFPSHVFYIFPPEDTVLNSRFPVPPARDPDAGVNGVQRYRLFHGQGVFGLDVVESPGGEIQPHLTVLQNLDREQQDTYVMTIQAEDGGTPPKSSTAMLQVMLADVNDNQPVFRETQVEARVAENAPAGTSVIRLHATDADAGFNAEIQYLFDPQVTPETKRLFALNSSTGLITVQGPLDREQAAVHKVTVLASDRGPTPAQVTVTVRVTDVNDNAPAIHLRYIRSPINGIVYLYENEPVHTKIAMVTVSDKDAGVNGRVTCSIDREVPFHLKVVHNNLYLLETSSLLDYEGTSEFSFQIVASDSGKPRLSQTSLVRVRLEDENDNRPVFSPPVIEVSVSENNPSGLSLTTISATDEDSGKNGDVVYQLGPNASLFGLDRKTGVLTAVGIFNREEQERFVFTVTARDRGTPPLQGQASVVVTVLDENDNSPKFTQNPFQFFVPENLPQWSTVGVVTVTDADAGENKAVTLSLLNEEENFVLDPFSGAIQSHVSFDREQQGAYTLDVKAVDGGQPPRSATAKVTIQVTDVNDNSPVVIYPPSNSSFAWVPLSAAPGSVVAEVFAVDRDTGRNAELQYAIASGNNKGLFRIDPLTGNITLAEKPAPADVGLHCLAVNVSDSGEPRALHTLALVFLYVNDTAENAVYIYDLIRRTMRTPLDRDVGDSSQPHQNEDSLTLVIAIAACAMVVLVVIFVAFLVHCQYVSRFRAARRSQQGATGPAASQENKQSKRKESSLWNFVPVEDATPDTAAREPVNMTITLPAELGEQGIGRSDGGTAPPTTVKPSSPDLAKHYRSTSLQSAFQLQPGTPASVRKHHVVQELPPDNTFVGDCDTLFNTIQLVPVPPSAIPKEASRERAPCTPDE
uniref:Cadherin domain-containing protein n=1 Tax=Pelodiscus sinensis TaxID=13735 RepID=K7EY04_PELSI